MTILNMLDPLGESRRLDYIIGEHEKLQRQVKALTALLVEKGVLSAADLSEAFGEGSAATDEPV